MTKQEMRDLIEAASKSADVPAIKVIPAGMRTINHAVDPLIAKCDCGCRGNWTDHTMRLGERGIY